MTLSELQEIVAKSSAQDWQRTSTFTQYSWEYGGEDETSFLRPVLHPIHAVLKNDVDVSIVMGATYQEDFQETWAEKFPDSHASSVSVQVRYRGVPIYEIISVMVDGGRYLLPMPELVKGKYHLNRSDLPVARLLFDLFCGEIAGRGYPRSLDEALTFAEIEVV